MKFDLIMYNLNLSSYGQLLSLFFITLENRADAWSGGQTAL